MIRAEVERQLIIGYRDSKERFYPICTYREFLKANDLDNDLDCVEMGLNYTLKQGPHPKGFQLNKFPPLVLS